METTRPHQQHCCAGLRRCTWATSKLTDFGKLRARDPGTALHGRVDIFPPRRLSLAPSTRSYSEDSFSHCPQRKAVSAVTTSQAAARASRILWHWTGIRALQLPDRPCHRRLVHSADGCRRRALPPFRSGCPAFEDGLLVHRAPLEKPEGAKSPSPGDWDLRVGGKLIFQGQTIRQKLPCVAGRGRRRRRRKPLPCLDLDVCEERRRARQSPLR